MRIGVIGSGRVGTTLATAWAAVGHEVRLGSREPDPSAPVPTVAIPEAADGADVVVNTAPGTHAIALLTAQPAGWLDGTVLWDVSNADDGAGRLAYAEGSLAEHLQRAFPRAGVVKALNTFSRTVMVNPQLLPEPTTVFVSGDDDRAKDRVRALLNDLGWPDDSILDLGGIVTARAVELALPLYYAVRDAIGTKDFNYRVVWNRGSVDRRGDDDDVGYGDDPTNPPSAGLIP